MSHGNISLWAPKHDRLHFPLLSRPVDVDVAVIGAGITGLTAAYHLIQQGYKVAVLEAERIGDGTTGHSSAHLTSFFDHSYEDLEKSYGREEAALVCRSLEHGIDLIEATTTDLGIHCSFARVPGYYFAEEESDCSTVDGAFEAALRTGLDVTRATPVPLPFATASGFVVQNQAQFHPVDYLHGLCSALLERGCQIFERSRVIDVHSGTPCTVTTDLTKMTAENIIMATHTPLGRNILHSEVAPYRSYVLAAKVKETVPTALFWDTADPYNYIRVHYTDQGPVVVVGGQDIKVGHGGETQAFARLRDYVTRRFNVEKILFQWSAQLYEPVDHLPYIGKIPFSDHIFTGTGFSGDGLTLGSLAGYMMAEQISGNSTPYDRIFRPARANPAGLPSFIRENLDVAKGLVLDRVFSQVGDNLDEIENNDGRVFRSGLTSYAAYRDKSGKLRVFSGLCPHMKCVVKWNNAQKTFDCPCHGSRFDIDGDVLEGPATQGLTPIHTKAIDEDDVFQWRQQEP